MRFAGLLVLGSCALFVLLPACSALLDTESLSNNPRIGASSGGAGNAGSSGQGGSSLGNTSGSGGSTADGGGAGSARAGAGNEAGAAGDAGASTGGTTGTGGGAGKGGTGGGAGKGGTGGAAGTSGTGGKGGSGGGSTCVPSTSGKEECNGIDDDCNSTTPDVCPKGCVGFAWKGKGYMGCNKSLTWSASTLACLQQNMTLVQVDSAAENAMIMGQIGSYGPWIFLGAQGPDNAGSLKWPDGTAITKSNTAVKTVYTNFSPGQPELKNAANCLQVSNGISLPVGTWSNTPCTDEEPFVCESAF